MVSCDVILHKMVTYEQDCVMYSLVSQLGNKNVS